MDGFERLKAEVGEVQLCGQNLEDVGIKSICDISDDKVVDAIYEINRLLRDHDLENVKTFSYSARLVSIFQARADERSKLIQDEKAFKGKVKKSLSYLKNAYLNSLEQVNYEEITQFPVSEGKVILPNEVVIHNTLLSQVAGISRGGLLASEWFGEFEAEGEGRFCCFLSRTNGNGNWKHFIGKASLFFDTDSQFARQLFSMDFFAYEKLKLQNPELCKNFFSPELIELFDTVIEPLSEAGRINEGGRYSSWMAIVGGVPPQLVKGIMLSSKEENLEELAEYCSNQFPRAIIFDDNKNVLRMPKGKGDEEKPKSM